MSESFGMQLDDDSLLALYSWVSISSEDHGCSRHHRCPLKTPVPNVLPLLCLLRPRCSVQRATAAPPAA